MSPDSGICTFFLLPKVSVPAAWPIALSGPKKRSSLTVAGPCRNLTCFHLSFGKFRRLFRLRLSRRTQTFYVLFPDVKYNTAPRPLTRRIFPRIVRYACSACSARSAFLLLRRLPAPEPAMPKPAVCVFACVRFENAKYSSKRSAFWCACSADCVFLTACFKNARILTGNGRFLA